jgi:cyclohexa-1,5-dienecarbonyl-CoA hydratase
LDELGFRTFRQVAPVEKKAEVAVAAGGSRIALAAEPPVMSITLQHAPVNVIDIAMMEELSAALDGVEAQREISIVTFRGSERAFSAGVDVAAHAPDRIDEMLSKFHEVILKLVASRKVTVAAVRGNCLGGGAELAMVCDLVFTAEDAQWGFPEIKLGCYPPVAVTALAALIGQKHAADLILSGRTITGTEAAGLGLANKAVAGSELEGAVNEAVERVKALSPAALAITKKALYAWDSVHFDKGLARAEKIYREDLMQTEDAREGINAFLEKRSPHWNRS